LLRIEKYREKTAAHLSVSGKCREETPGVGVAKATRVRHRIDSLAPNARRGPSGQTRKCWPATLEKGSVRLTLRRVGAIFRKGLDKTSAKLSSFVEDKRFLIVVES
jgi:hypothetical protein